MYAPIAVFGFNRPLHLRQTLDALARNTLAEVSDVLIFCDGPRCSSDKPLVAAVRCVAEKASGFNSVRLVISENNKGLAASICSGVEMILSSTDRVIVVEDDLVTSPFFLQYINDGLDVYCDNPSVASIHGHCFPCKRKAQQETFFLKGADCWGWGTWDRAWKVYNPDALWLASEIIKNGEYVKFNRNFTYDYVQMLLDVHTGKTSSWAVRWLASTWLNNMYTLYPRQTLVKNIGLDGSGTNCSDSNCGNISFGNCPVTVKKMPVVEDNAMVKELMVSLENEAGGKIAKFKRAIKHYFPFLLTIKKSIFQ